MAYSQGNAGQYPRQARQGNAYDPGSKLWSPIPPAPLYSPTPGGYPYLKPDVAHRRQTHQPSSIYKSQKVAGYLPQSRVDSPQAVSQTQTHGNHAYGANAPHSSPYLNQHPSQNYKGHSRSMTVPQTYIAASSGRNPVSLPRQSRPTVIFVMGETGVGKSTFTSYATGRNVKVNEGLESCTQDVELYEIPGTNIYLADSPGFGDTYRNDASILKNLDDALAELFHDEEVKISGVLYLHSLSDARMKSTPLRNIIMLSKLVGSSNMNKCRLVTTKISQAPRNPSEIEEELCNKQHFWQPLVKKGATVARFNDLQDSAYQIIRPLLGNHKEIVLKMTRETQIESRTLGDTAAGKVVNEEINKARKEVAADMAQSKRDIKKARAERDFLHAQVLEIQWQEDEEKIMRFEHDQEMLQRRTAVSKKWDKKRWKIRVASAVMAAGTIMASGGVLTPLAMSLHNANMEVTGPIGRL